MKHTSECDLLIEHPTVLPPVTVRTVVGLDGRPATPTDYSRVYRPKTSKTVQLCGCSVRTLREGGSVYTRTNYCGRHLCHPRKRSGRFVPGCGEEIVKAQLAAAWEAWRDLDTVYVGWFVPEESPDDPWIEEELEEWVTTPTPRSEWTRTRERLTARAKSHTPRPNLATYLTTTHHGRRLFVFSDQPMTANPRGRGRPTSQPRTLFPLDPVAALSFLHRSVLVVGRTESVTATREWADLARKVRRRGVAPGGASEQVDPGEVPRLVQAALERVRVDLEGEGVAASLSGDEGRPGLDVQGGDVPPDLTTRIRKAIEGERGTFSAVAPYIPT